MLELLRPKLYVASVPEIDLEELKARRLRGLILDVDNTLVERNRSHLSPQVEAWVRRAKEEGFQLCIASNSIGSQRIAALAARLGIPYITWAAKPRRRPFRLGMAMMGTLPQETAVVGDQLFTDILGGNRLGLFTILVQPLTSHDFLPTRWSRCLEQWLLRRFFPQGPQRRRAQGEEPCP